MSPEDDEQREENAPSGLKPFPAPRPGGRCGRSDWDELPTLTTPACLNLSTLLSCSGVLCVLTVGLGGHLVSKIFNREEECRFTNTYLENLSLMAASIHESAFVAVKQLGEHRLRRIFLLTSQGYLMIAVSNTNLIVALCDANVDLSEIFGAFCRNAIIDPNAPGVKLPV